MRRRRRRRPAIIALLGVDGVGKTTQARLLARTLSAAGQPASYFENGGGRPIVDALARLLGRRDGPDLLGSRVHVAVEATFRGLAITRALALSRLTGRIAVMDRYAYCQYAVMRLRGDGDGRRAAGARRLPPVSPPPTWWCCSPSRQHSPSSGSNAAAATMRNSTG